MHSRGSRHWLRECVYLQPTLNTQDTLKAKIAYKEHCTLYGVVVHKYLSDNGTAFQNAGFTKHLQAFKQHTRYSAPGAHYSNNGMAERAIRTTMSISCAMLHHSAIHWPGVVLHAVYTVNRLSGEDSGQSPLELFSHAQCPWLPCVEGAPIYVLDSKEKTEID